jgi:hypothetical protein
MGHRRNRKTQRKSEQRGRDGEWTPSGLNFFSDEIDTEFAMLLELQRPGGQAVVATACGSCQEFVEDQEGGRGTCLHPGSGVLAPWTDSAGCQFHTRRRGL